MTRCNCSSCSGSGNSYSLIGDLFFNDAYGGYV